VQKVRGSTPAPGRELDSVADCCWQQRVKFWNVSSAQRIDLSETYRSQTSLRYSECNCNGLRYIICSVGLSVIHLVVLNFHNADSVKIGQWTCLWSGEYKPSISRLNSPYCLRSGNKSPTRRPFCGKRAQTWVSAKWVYIIHVLYIGGSNYIENSMLWLQRWAVN